MDWSQYEREVEAELAHYFAGCQVSRNVRLPGKMSGTHRQIDAVVEIPGLGRIVVESKCYQRRIHVKDVEAFLSMMQDVGASYGMMVSLKGYTPAAERRAYNDPSGLELEVLSMDSLRDSQGACGIPYAESKGFILPAPFGWVVDADTGGAALAFLFGRGLSFDEALERGEYIYVSFWIKDEQASTIESLNDLQVGNVREIIGEPEVSFLPAPERRDARTRIRRMVLGSYPSAEFTGFVEFDEFIFFAVLFTRAEHEQKNLRKLLYVMARIMPIEIEVRK